MADVKDVAAYILEKCGGMTAMKLQKLCYYAQAWTLVWSERPLFNNEIQAWANGPVVVDLYRAHKGCFRLDVLPEGDAENVNQTDRGHIDKVIEAFGRFSAHELSEFTHQDAPWIDAREGMCPGQRGDSEITQAAMFEYYGGLTSTNSVSVSSVKVEA